MKEILEKLRKQKESGEITDSQIQELIEGLTELLDPSSRTPKATFLIKVHYETGSSFGSEETCEILDYPWNNVDIVRENLVAIEEHNNFVRSLESSYRTRSEDLIKSAKQKWWFRNKDDDGGSRYISSEPYKYSMYLKKNDGTKFLQSVPWIGYFERYHRSEIITIGEDERN